MDEKTSRWVRLKTWAVWHERALLCWFFFACLAFEGVWALAKHVFAMSHMTYQTFAISEWMINFRGGFVRRGIVGEMLWWLYQWCPFPLGTWVILLVAASFLALMFLLYKLFRKEGWSLILFPSVLLGVPAFATDIAWARKDYFMLLVCFALFFLYRRFIRSEDRRGLSFLLLQALAVLLLLVHEATFFFTIPLLICHLFFTLYKKEGRGVGLSVCRSLLFFSPAFVAMAAVCLCKGGEGMAETIWQSWQPLMERFPREYNGAEGIGAGVKFLERGALDTFLFHFKLNFGGWFVPHTPIPAFPFQIYCFVAVYYAATRMQTADLGFYPLKSLDRVRLSNLLLVQGIFMLPMFTVLSCDGQRTVPYWVISTLFAYHFSKDCQLWFPQRLTRFSERVQRWIDGKPALNNPLVYFLILITIPLAPCYNATLTCYLFLAPFKAFVKYVLL